MPVAERRRFQAIMGYPDRFEWPQAKSRGKSTSYLIRFAVRMKRMNLLFDLYIPNRSQI
jgi:hypothetical protein